MLLDHAARLGRKRLAFVRSDSEAGRLHLRNVNRVAAERGILLVTPIAFSGRAGVATIARQIVDKQAGMVLKHGGYAMYAQLIKAVRALGSTAQFLAVNSGGQEFANAAGADGQGTIMTQSCRCPHFAGWQSSATMRTIFGPRFPRNRSASPAWRGRSAPG